MLKKIDYKSELNAAQSQAVLSTEGPFLVIAGAGSGKTRVLVYRTAYLVEKGIAPENILLLTFTRRASQEMLSRAAELLDDRCHRVSGGTFHSFANAMLRRFSRQAGLAANFSILDQADAESALGMIRTRMGLNKADLRFPKKGALLSLISKSVNKGIAIEPVIFDEYPHFLEWADTIQQVAEEYVRYKKSMAVLDFDDLLVSFRDLLRNQDEVRQQLSRYYRYIMVDEYQDTNKMQAQIVQLLTEAHQNVMVVGDDAQSIYSFRGAHYKNIIDFPCLYPETQVIMLEENYRSSQPILDLTNAIISQAEEKFEKELFTRNPGETRPVYVEVPDENSQSRYVVEKIARLRSRGVKLNEIAVLFRSGWHSNDLEIELSGQGIPFVKHGGQKFVEAAHVKDVLSYLTLIHNPSHEISWLRVLSLIPGIGPRTAEEICRSVKSLGGGSGFAVDPKWLGKKEELKRLFELLNRMSGPHKPAEVLEVFLGYYYPFLVSQYDDHDKRAFDLDSLHRIAARYDSLENFLADLSLEPLEKSQMDAQREGAADERLILSTIHSAKGLEWHTVFILYVADGYLPSYRSQESAAMVEEERRLFYVAATRAKENLFLLRPQVDRSARSEESVGGVYTRPSRFLNQEIFSRLVEVDTDFASHGRW